MQVHTNTIRTSIPVSCRRSDYCDCANSFSRLFPFSFAAFRNYNHFLFEQTLNKIKLIGRLTDCGTTNRQPKMLSIFSFRKREIEINTQIYYFDCVFICFDFCVAVKILWMRTAMQSRIGQANGIASLFAFTEFWEKYSKHRTRTLMEISNTDNNREWNATIHDAAHNRLN